MNNKIKKINVFLITLICLLPLSLEAQNQNPYESIQRFSHEQIVQMLAPIALYPDALLSQILIAAAYPFEVAEAGRWLDRNPHLVNETLDNALQEKEWDVSVLSLCHYPKVIKIMNENLSWTAKLGDAFVYQQQDVMDTVQELRSKARAQGNLVSTNEQRVIVEEKIIRIVPAYDRYLYVPVYDPFVVYGTWWYPTYLPYRIFYPGVSIGASIAFSPRLWISFGVIGWSYFDWPSRCVTIVHINRTKRFNKNYHVYDKPQHIYWKPNHHKRTERQIPEKQGFTFHPPIRPLPQKVMQYNIPQRTWVPRVSERNNPVYSGPVPSEGTRNQRSIQPRDTGTIRPLVSMPPNNSKKDINQPAINKKKKLDQSKSIGKNSSVIVEPPFLAVKKQQSTSKPKDAVTAKPLIRIPNIAKRNISPPEINKNLHPNQSKLTDKSGPAMVMPPSSVIKKEQSRIWPGYAHADKHLVNMPNIRDKERAPSVGGFSIGGRTTFQTHDRRGADLVRRLREK